MLNTSQALNILIGKTNASQQCSNCNHNILQKRGIKEGRRRSRKDLWQTGLTACNNGQRRRWLCDATRCCTEALQDCDAVLQGCEEDGDG